MVLLLWMLILSHLIACFGMAISSLGQFGCSTGKDARWFHQTLRFSRHLTIMLEDLPSVFFSIGHFISLGYV